MNNPNPYRDAADILLLLAIISFATIASFYIEKHADAKVQKITQEVKLAEQGIK